MEKPKQTNDGTKLAGHPRTVAYVRMYCDGTTYQPCPEDGPPPGFDWDWGFPEYLGTTCKLGVRPGGSVWDD